MTKLGSQWLLLFLIASMTPLRSVSAMPIQLTGICCGVYGSSDVPYVDLYSFAPSSTQPNRASVLAIGPGRIPFSAQGSFSFKPVSEPGSAMLVGGGLVLLALCGVMRRRRSQPVHARSGNSKRS